LQPESVQRRQRLGQARLGLVPEQVLQRVNDVLLAASTQIIASTFTAVTVSRAAAR
jgi:hypothetical protein